ncbi:MAG: hypothetical protein J0H63_01150 [Rhizobiales bacterium]|nr:hypothetical protein [Hyphomicrobiales bacterium]MBN9008778.1 hypothetical protein [Hyphomicrobiales bacterium]
MRRGWLAPFTRADGRSLTRALAALLFLNAFVVGLHGGFAATPGAYAATVICHVAAGDPAPVPSADHAHDADCCMPAAASAALSLPVLAGRDPLPPAFATLAPEGQLPPPHGVLTRAGPRAPPFLPA